VTSTSAHERAARAVRDERTPERIAWPYGIHPRSADLLYGRSKRSSESGVVVVFLLLGVIWAAVLIPPWLQARREARPIASIMSFRSQLWSLQRATPTYGDTYGETYGVHGDEGDDLAGEVAGVAASSAGGAGHALGSTHGGAAPRVAPGLVSTVVRSAEDGTPRGLSRAATAVGRRAHTFRRRRRVLCSLVLLTGAGVAPALLLGGPWVAAVAAPGMLLVAYLGLLVRHGRREVERVQKVRYLTPIRAPRPSVVVIGSGAAR
jgi:hypothetical protein